MDKAAEEHGLKLMLFLRFCPLFPLNLFIQLVALTGVSYKNFVKGGFSAIVPITFKVIQGTQIASVKALDEDVYETMKLYDVYNFLGTMVSLIFGLGSLIYYTLLAFR